MSSLSALSSAKAPSGVGGPFVPVNPNSHAARAGMAAAAPGARAAAQFPTLLGDRNAVIRRGPSLAIISRSWHYAVGIVMTVWTHLASATSRCYKNVRLAAIIFWGWKVIADWSECAVLCFALFCGIIDGAKVDQSTARDAQQ